MADFTPAEVEKIKRFLREHFPERWREMKRRGLFGPRGGERFRKMAPRIERMMDLMDRNPRAGRLMLQQEELTLGMRRLANRFVRTDDAEARSQIRAKLKKMAARRFELKMKLRRQEVERLSRRLAEIKEQIERDSASRDVQIKRALENLGVSDD